ncbi:hypothetical protein N7451_012288 [Penicillium sp. IBT 35674x]|nr:hypothetical protein N7451_012288 [Penicillium sp. IBT 35674x]
MTDSKTIFRGVGEEMFPTFHIYEVEMATDLQRHPKNGASVTSMGFIYWVAVLPEESRGDVGNDHLAHFRYMTS